jgi:hypothetical protein
VSIADAVCTADSPVKNYCLKEMLCISIIIIIKLCYLFRIDAELSAVTMPSVVDGERHVDRIYCHQGATVTRAIINIDANLPRLSVSDRVAILRRLARFLQLPVTTIYLIPPSNAIDLGYYSRLTIICFH